MRTPSAQNDDELFDVVDVNDNVIRQERRVDVHENEWLHRAVHIWLFDPEGRLLLQMRSSQKDQYPSTWTSSASGHVDAGEDYQTAARRELAEELAIRIEDDAGLQFRTKLVASPETAFEFTSLWTLTTRQTPQPHPIEVERLEWWSVSDAISESRRTPTSFSPPLRQLLSWWEHFA